MTIIDWYRVVISRFADFTGRSSRSEFWWYFLANILISAALGTIGDVMTDITGFSIFNNSMERILSLFSILIFLPNLSVTIRRLHDTGRSGLNLLWVFLPVVGLIVLITFLASKGQPYENKWGSESDGLDILEDEPVDYEQDII